MKQLLEFAAHHTRRYAALKLSALGWDNERTRVGGEFGEIVDRNGVDPADLVLREIDGREWDQIA